MDNGNGTSKQIGKYLCIFISDLLHELESTV